MAELSQAMSKPPAGEVAELVGLFRSWADSYPDGVKLDPQWLTRAADLLERQAAPVPVAVDERPWEREGWCDSEGRCWIHCPGQSWDTWVLMVPQNAIDGAHCLPATALPKPSGEV